MQFIHNYNSVIHWIHLGRVATLVRRGQVPIYRTYWSQEPIIHPHSHTSESSPMATVLHNFSVIYEPGSKNSQADTLSCIYEKAQVNLSNSHILNPSIIIAPVRWDIVTDTKNFQHPGWVSTECQTKYLFLPENQGIQVIQWIHTLSDSGHPSISRTNTMVRQQFWWPTLTTDVTNYVQGCQVCPQSHTPQQLPVRHLEPLSIPRRPWSHIAI